MTLNPWKRLEEQRWAIEELELANKQKAERLANRYMYIKQLEDRLIDHERKMQSLRGDKADLQSYLDGVWQVTQEWKPPHVVRVYGEGGA